jgi:Cu2+-exporting ATPase/Cu+-exporting ATPase
MTQTLAKAEACLHCGEPAPFESKFCCAGCESVYSLLLSRGLTHYYELRSRYSIAKPRAYSQPASQAYPETADARLYIEGIHCLGCLWLLEKLPEIEPRVRESSLDLAHQILRVKIGPGIGWEEVSRTLGQLGYSAQFIEKDEGASIRLRDQRRQLWRVALAGFSAGNVMLLSVSLYAGADAWWARHFGWLSLGLAAPALTYSAWPIYRSAFAPLRHGRISVDLAIAFALLAGTAMSLWSLRQGGTGVYFDSLTMLIFLLLSSRYALSRMRESLANEGLSFLGGEMYETEAKGLCRASELEIGDRISLRQGQSVPADCRLLSASAYFDLSLLTGESRPEKLRAGDAIESGTRALGQPRLQVLRPAGESRLSRILDQIQAFRAQRSPGVEFADRLGRWFVLVVLILALLTLAWLPGEEGLRRALALVIVTCPCVLAFAVPLTLTRALQIAARQGIVIRGAEKLEELAAVKSVFLDKTGTLTNGQFELLEWRDVSGNAQETRAACRALESQSAHPVAKAITRALPETNATASAVREIPATGIEGLVNNEHWSVRRLEGSDGLNLVGVFRGEELRSQITLGDSLRPEAARVARDLRGLGLELTVLSGDSESSVAGAARALGLKEWHSRLTPEAKAAITARKKNSAMVGDGANDSVAFQGASVGIAMQGSMELSLKNADIQLTKPGLGSLVTAIKISRRTARLLRINFSFTLAYNIAAGSLALAGLMSPLLAAVLMPASAATVFAFTFWQTKGGEL